MAQFKGVQKVALLMAAIGEESAAKVLSILDPEEQDWVGQALVELEEETIKDDAIGAILGEFRDLLYSGSNFQAGLGRTLRGVLTRAHGEEEGIRRLERIRRESRSRFPFRALRGIKATELARVLQEEHAQVQALVLANLDSSQAAEILSEYGEDAQVELVCRMAQMEEPSPRLLKQVAAQMVEKSRGLAREDDRGEVEDDVRLKIVADILNASEPGADKEILGKIEEDHEEMVTQIRERMFAWDDLMRLDKRTMQKILAGIDTKLLALALKACENDVMESILSAVSQRTKDMILEEKELVGAVPLADVMDAQKQILATVRELVEAGEIRVSMGKGAQFVS